METLRIWLSSLPAIAGIVLIALGIWAVVTRQLHKNKTTLEIPHVGKIETRSAAYLLFAFAAFFFVLSQQTFEKNREFEFQSRRLEASEQIISRFITPELLQSQTFGNIFRELPETFQNELLLKIATLLKSELNDAMDGKKSNFTDRDLQTTWGPATFIYKIKPDNGHALYFRGEVKRLLGDREAFRRYFDRYLTNSEKSEGKSGPTGGNECYERALGYCLERTAYICHLMALDFYRESMEYPAVLERNAKEGLGYVKCVYDLRGKSFRQGEDTGKLKEFFEKQLAQTSP